MYTSLDSPPTVLQKVQFFVWKFYMSLQSFLFKLNQKAISLQRNFTLKPVTPTRHKILILGDSLAAGYGDNKLSGSLTELGLCQYLPNEIKTQEAIRQEWQVVSYSKMNSMTSEWRMDSKTNLLAKVLITSKLYSDAELVILCVGNDDKLGNLASYQASALNIVSIIQSIHKLNKHIFVCSPLLPPKLIESSDFFEQDSEGFSLREKNEMRRSIISRFIEFCNCKNEKELGIMLATRQSYEAWFDDDFKIDHDYIISFAVDLSNGSYRRKDMFHSDQIHLCSSGYQRLSRDLLHVIKQPLIKMEFAVWKRVINNELSVEEATGKRMKITAEHGLQREGIPLSGHLY